MKTFTIEYNHGPTEKKGHCFSMRQTEAKSISQAAKKLYTSWINPTEWFRIVAIREVGPGVTGKVCTPKRWKTKNCKRR